jgi:hypothetical protein
MKKIILATVLLVTTTFSAFAKDVDTKLLKELTIALKTSPDVQWSTTDSYTRAAFRYNGKEVYAFYDVDEALIGFSIHVDQQDLPPSFVRTVEQKYAGWSIVETIMFIDAKADSGYFYQLKKDNKNLAVKAYRNGRIEILSKFPS